MAHKDELKVVKNNTSNIDININKIINRESLLNYQELVLNIPISDNLINFAVKFVHNTRPVNTDAPSITKKYINWGAGPRASSYLVMAAKAKAVLLNKPTPDMDDMISVIKPVLRHRIFLILMQKLKALNLIIFLMIYLNQINNIL